MAQPEAALPLSAVRVPPPVDVGEDEAVASEPGDAQAPASATEPPSSAAAGGRMREQFDANFNFVWRYLRRLGLSPADADDAAQQVFVIFARKIERVEAGKERAYLCAVAVRVCSEARRARARRREVHPAEPMEITDAADGPDGIADRKRARRLLDQVLDEMDDKLRSVFVLFELEELNTATIAEMLDIPTGTVASRLRRGREQFRAIVKRLRARGDLG